MHSICMAMMTMHIERLPKGSSNRICIAGHSLVNVFRGYASGCSLFAALPEGMSIRPLGVVVSFY
jgi:hypothetical protein